MGRQLKFDPLSPFGPRSIQLVQGDLEASLTQGQVGQAGAHRFSQAQRRLTTQPAQVPSRLVIPLSRLIRQPLERLQRRQGCERFKGLASIRVQSGQVLGSNLQTARAPMPGLHLFLDLGQTLLALFTGARIAMQFPQHFLDLDTRRFEQGNPGGQGAIMGRQLGQSLFALQQLTSYRAFPFLQ